jgi:hypothetical protein
VRVGEERTQSKCCARLYWMRMGSGESSICKPAPGKIVGSEVQPCPSRRTGIPDQLDALSGRTIPAPPVGRVPLPRPTPCNLGELQIRPVPAPAASQK